MLVLTMNGEDVLSNGRGDWKVSQSVVLTQTLFLILVRMRLRLQMEPTRSK
jgi:hypothetical protein